MPENPNASPASSAPEVIIWAPQESPVSIEYPLEVMSRIRDHVIVGFHRLARRGIECGGVLYGRRKGRRISIEATREIRCEYRSGPTFILSDSDREALAAQLSNTDSPGLQDLIPVGFYVSHTKDDITVTERDLVVYDGFFGDPWQVMLVLRPGRQGAVRAGFFVRETLGGLQTERSYEEFELDPPDSPAEAAALMAAARMPLGGAGESSPAAASGQSRPRRVSPALPIAEISSPAAANGGTPGAMGTTAILPYTAASAGQSASGSSLAAPFEPPRFAALHSSGAAAAAGAGPATTSRGSALSIAAHHERHWIWLAAWVGLVFVVAGSVYWLLSLRNPDPILLRVSEQSGDLRIEWDRASNSIQHASSGTLEIRDGARTRTIKLSTDQLALGSYLFPAGATDVAIRLSVSAFLRPTVEESAHFVGEALTGTGPRGSVEIREQRDRLLLENRRLKSEIRRLEDRLKLLEDGSRAGRPRNKKR